jgi:hypothetical protein
MATKKEKQELIDVLKFTPIKVNLYLQGYGGESYAGTVDRKIYDYFKQRRLDINEFAWDSDYAEIKEIPEDMLPFYAGSPYECNNLFHASGAELSDLNQLSINDENGKTVWEHNLGYSDLEEAGVSVNEGGGGEFLDLVNEDKSQVIFWGGQGEKGCFFDAEFTLTAPFDPKKLTIYYENCDDWYIITSIEYSGEELDGFGGYSTTGKWSEAKWILLSDEEVYEPSDEDDEDISVLDNKEIQAQEAIDTWDPAAELDKIAEDMMTEWYSVDIKPIHKGEYECEFESASWPFPIERMCEWTGRSWKEHGKKAVGIKRWRGLKFNPSEI